MIDLRKMAQEFLYSDAPSAPEKEGSMGGHTVYLTITGAEAFARRVAAAALRDAAENMAPWGYETRHDIKARASRIERGEE